jgi:hypothetical protein
MEVQKRYAPNIIGRYAVALRTAATSSPVIRLEPPDCKRKFEEPPYVYPSALRDDKKKKPKFRYIELPGGSKPLMSPIHVAFAANSVALLRQNPTLIGPELIAQWNKDHSEEWNNDHANNSLPKRGRGASGRADNFFNNGYFLMPQLQGMARGELRGRRCRSPIRGGGSGLADGQAGGRRQR